MPATADLYWAAMAVLLILIVGFWYRTVRKRTKTNSRFSLESTREVRAGDGLKYRVHTSHKNADSAADTMAELNRRAIELIRHLRDKYLRGPAAGRSSARKKAVSRLLERYNPDSLAENSPCDPGGDTSFTIDKGAILALCLREKDPAQSGDPAAHDIHSLNTLAFVLVHELTHIAIKDSGHPPRYWQAFKFILEEAVETGFLEKVDYGRHPVQYCGETIEYSPLFDHSVQALV
ncbi:metal-dependent hydrolase [Elysia marginata]|uniref:Metal-dependent hydrolase n=1 Tax=Elysia marginata TaxID=1093978 RepID=A0AAV4GTB2_9GAST|nr:metal-dependent hydrolase [Elysia marginata]